MHFPEEFVLLEWMMSSLFLRIQKSPMYFHVSLDCLIHLRDTLLLLRCLPSELGAPMARLVPGLVIPGDTTTCSGISWSVWTCMRMGPKYH